MQLGQRCHDCFPAAATETKPTSTCLHAVRARGAITSEQWQQVYQYARASDDFKTFSAFLETAQLPVASPGSAVSDLSHTRPHATANGGQSYTQAAPQVTRLAATTASATELRASVSGSAPEGRHAELTSDLAWKHARENVIIVTWTNFHFYDFVANWVAHLSNHRAPSCLQPLLHIFAAICNRVTLVEMRAAF